MSTISGDEGYRRRAASMLADMAVQSRAVQPGTLQPRAVQPRAAAVRYDRRGRRILVLLTNGLELGVPVKLAQRLAGKSAADLEAIEISPTGLVLRWPKLDVDLYLPALLSGVFGSRRERWSSFWAGWMDVSSADE